MKSVLCVIKMQMFYGNIFILFISDSGTGTDSHASASFCYKLITRLQLISTNRRHFQPNFIFIEMHRRTNDTCATNTFRLFYYIRSFVSWFSQSPAISVSLSISWTSVSMSSISVTHRRSSSAVRRCWPSAIVLVRILDIIFFCCFWTRVLTK